MERYDLGDKLRDRVSTRKFFFNIGTIARTSRRVVEDRIESNRVEREVSKNWTRVKLKGVVIKSNRDGINKNNERA